ncbi:glycosyltransferase [Kineococcus sp. NUM-3379]
MTADARAGRATPPVRVVHLITGLTLGGAERHVEMLVERSTADSTVIALRLLGPVGERMRQRGAAVELLGMDGAARWSAVPRLVRRLRQLRPDVVHVHLLSAQLHGLPAARLAGVPVVVSSEHSLMATAIEGRPLTPVLRRVYLALERLADVTIAVSAETAERLRRLGVAASRTRVVDNGIDFSAFRFDAAARREVRSELGLGEEVRVLLTAGRLDPVKRVDVLLRAVAPSLGAHTHLLVVGTGPLQPALADLAADLGVASYVTFLGARSDLPRVVNAADVFVNASRDETFGMAVVEAAGNGLPVVFAECPGLDRVLDRGVDAAASGWYPLPPLPRPIPADREVADLRAAVESALAGPLARRQPAPELLAAYDLAVMAASVEGVYSEFLRRRRSSRARAGSSTNR